MTDTSAAAQIETPTMFSYRIELLNGRWYDVTAPFTLELFILLVKVHGVITGEVYAPHHAIAAITRNKHQPPLASVVNFPGTTGGGAA